MQSRAISCDLVRASAAKNPRTNWAAQAAKMLCKVLVFLRFWLGGKGPGPHFGKAPQLFPWLGPEVVRASCDPISCNSCKLVQSRAISCGLPSRFHLALDGWGGLLFIENQPGGPKSLIFSHLVWCGKFFFMPGAALLVVCLKAHVCVTVPGKPCILVMRIMSSFQSSLLYLMTSWQCLFTAQQQR